MYSWLLTSTKTPEPNTHIWGECMGVDCRPNVAGKKIPTATDEYEAVLPQSWRNKISL